MARILNRSTSSLFYVSFGVPLEIISRVGCSIGFVTSSKCLTGPRRLILTLSTSPIRMIGLGTETSTPKSRIATLRLQSVTIRTNIPGDASVTRSVKGAMESSVTSVTTLVPTSVARYARIVNTPITVIVVIRIGISYPFGSPTFLVNNPIPIFATQTARRTILAARKKVVQKSVVGGDIVNTLLTSLLVIRTPIGSRSIDPISCSEIPVIGEIVKFDNRSTSDTVVTFVTLISDNGYDAKTIASWS